ncbi:unnamed protein product [Lasius platythorax]|uniref:Uncharacterized protein n=1 Tax=Lasius platythorax TaxID=488582 RepID=A0AAV2N933_9HYME
MKGRLEGIFYERGIGIPSERRVGTAEGEPENHVHLDGVRSHQPREKWESKRSCQNQMRRKRRGRRKGRERLCLGKRIPGDTFHEDPRGRKIDEDDEKSSGICWNLGNRTNANERELSENRDPEEEEEVLPIG